jgi:predicted lactoylglutathione lyase
MNRQIFINLATKNLSEAKSFFRELGFQLNPKFSNEDGCCVIIADNISVMLLSESHFKNFTDKSICDSKKCAESLLCISCESRDEVDDLISKAKSLGANVSRVPQDHGFMYSHNFEDLDGHSWELMFMDQSTNN